MARTARQDKVRELQRTLYRAAKAEPGRRFHALYDKVYRRDVLERAWESVRANRGAAGIDRQTIADVEQYGIAKLLDELAADLKDGSYRPLAARRVFIPKPGSPTEQRPLSIPAVRDRVVQSALKTVIEPIFEADSAPRGVNQSRGMKGPAPGRRDGREKLGAVWLPRWGDPDGSSPDNVASVRRQRAERASKAERHRETEPVVEAPSLEASPETGGCGLSWCLIPRSRWGSSRSRASPSRGRGRTACCGAVWRCRRGKAGCRPCRAVVDERGKRPGGARRDRNTGRGAGAPSAVAAGAWRRDRSTRRRGKPGTWGRVPADARHDWMEGGRR